MLKLIGFDGKLILKLLFVFTFPNLFYKLKVAWIDPKTTDFFATIIKNSIKDRNESKEKKGDFIDFLTELGKVEGNKIAPEDMETFIIGSGLLVFFAGNDSTTSTALSITCYFLAQHQNLQDQLYQEIQVHLEKFKISKSSKDL